MNKGFQEEQGIRDKAKGDGVIGLSRCTQKIGRVPQALKRRESVKDSVAWAGFQPVAPGEPAGGFERSRLIRLLQQSSQRMRASW